MSMDKTGEALNRLVEINNDRDHLGAYSISMINAQMSLLKGGHDQVSAIREELRMYT
ncbi:MAG TPA: hypothetical protein PLR30_06715 [Saprospiraceae bacterium]|nr:hypothetical protein [Saprospiraceae bacterium]